MTPMHCSNLNNAIFYKILYYRWSKTPIKNFGIRQMKVANQSAQSVLPQMNNSQGYGYKSNNHSNIELSNGFTGGPNGNLEEGQIPPNNTQYLIHIQNRQKIQVGSLENGEITKFQFQKIIKIESALAFTIAISLFLIISAMEIKYTYSNKIQQFKTLIIFCLTFNCANTIIAIIISIIRFMAVLNLEKNRKAVYQNATLFTTKKIVWVFLQCLLILIQPYPFLQDLYFQTQNSYLKQRFLYPVNDLLAIMSLIRSYIIFRGLIMLTPYMNNRLANRLCKMYGCQANFSFSLKCLFKDNPLLLILILFSVSSLIFSYAVYLAERNYSSTFCQLSVACTYSNALWLILMTITTVGYGDYFPQTPLGRLIIFVVAIWGTFIVSIMVVVVANTLKMEKKQKQASIVIRKLAVREEVRHVAAKFIGFSVLKYYYKKKGNEQHLYKYNRQSKKIKKQFGILRRQLKSIRNDNDLYDEIASKFLNLNNDIDILNSNQQKIINFIHEKLQYRQINRDFVLRDLANLR